MFSGTEQHHARNHGGGNGVRVCCPEYLVDGPADYSGKGKDVDSDGLHGRSGEVGKATCACILQGRTRLLRAEKRFAGPGAQAARMGPASFRCSLLKP